MKKRYGRWAAALMAGLALPAAAQERPLCADRPGIGTPACTMAPGATQVELGLGDWTRDQDSAMRTDSLALGEALLRVGLDDHLEAQIGWTAYGHVRQRDRATGAVTQQDGTGDMTLALRRNLRNPDGSGFSVAVMPYVTLPTGGEAIGAGDWGAGLLVPSSVDLGRGLSLEAMGEVDAAVDADRSGRHLAYAGVLGLTVAISGSVSGAVEAAATRDQDPAGHGTQLLTGLSLAWQPSKAMQFDAGLNIGLNRESPDGELYVGVIRRF